MEPEVVVRLRKSDMNIYNDVVSDAIAQYKDMMLSWVPAFKGKKIPCKMIVDEKHYLPEYSDKEGEESCLGGLVFFAKKMRIMCSNTVEDRLALVYDEAIPAVRATLFPNFRQKKE